MREISIEKVTLNMGVGEPGNKLEKGQKLLSSITGTKTVQTTAKKRIPTWNLRPGLAIGCKVTVRGKKAEELFKRLVTSKEGRLKKTGFDEKGNLSFGIEEYINIPGVEYDPAMGIIGLQASVTFQRPGFRIRRRRLNQRTIPKSHTISKDDAIDYVSKTFEVKVK